MFTSKSKQQNECGDSLASPEKGIIIEEYSTFGGSFIDVKGGLTLDHQLGKYDFPIVEQEFPVTVFRRKISSVWRFVEITGHVAVITVRGKRSCFLQSIETYACRTHHYDETMQEINEMANQYREQQKEKRRKKTTK